MIYWSVLVLVCVMLAVVLSGSIFRRRARERALELEREIAERRLRDDQLVASEESLRAVLAASPVGICGMKNAICQWANEAMSAITGYGAAELEGRSLRFLFRNGGDYESAKRDLGGKDALDATWIRKDGGLCSVSIRASRADSDAHLWVVEDVTERVEAEKKLRLHEQRFRVFFESAGDPIVILEDGVVTDCNEKALTLFRRGRGEMVGSSIFDFSPPFQPDGLGSRKKMEEQIRACLPGTPRLFEWRFCRADESRFDADISLSRLDSYGRGLLHAVIRDVTDRKRLEDDTKRFNTAIEHAAEAVIITGPEGSIQYVNPAFEKITGYTRSDVIGRTPRILKSGVHDASFYRALWKTVKGGAVWTGRITNRRKDGELIREDAVISPLSDSSGRPAGFVALERDVTEEVRLEARLRHARHMEMTGQLAGGVAQEFNGILTAIMGYASLLKLKTAQDETCEPYVEQIIGAAEKAAGLARSLLEFGRNRVIDPRPLPLNEAVERQRALLKRLLPEDIELRTELSAEPVVVMADGGQVDQVLLYLVTNARDAMGHGGVLTVRTGRGMVGERTAEKNGFGTPGDYGVLSFSYTEPGMDEETKESLSPPYGRDSASAGEGTGAGLSVVYDIVKRHNGYILVTNEPGMGTVFDVYLPLANGETDDARRTTDGPRRKTDGVRPEDNGTHPEEPDLPRGTETILLAEDDADLRKLLCAVLKEHGYTTIEAEDGSDAVEKALRHEIDLVVTDVVMPKMNGWEAYQQIMKVKPYVPTLFVSGYAEDIILRKGVLDEELNFLSKPVTPAQLLAKVRSILDRERPAS